APSELSGEARMEKLVRLEHAGAGDNWRRHQERKIGGVGAVDAEDAGGRNRGARARDAGDDRERLAQPDEEGVEDREVFYVAFFRAVRISNPQEKPKRRHR